MQLKKLKKSVKKTITEHIDKTLLIRLSFNKDQITKLKWEHSKEFKYNSNMYDIVHKEIKSDSIIYWCWLDNDEANLEKSLNILIAKAIGEDQNTNPNKDTFKQLIKKTFLNQAVLQNIFAFIEINNHYKTPIFNLSSIPRKISSPPPEFSI